MFEDRLADVVALIIDIRDAGNFAAELVGNGGEVRGDRAAEQREAGGVIGMGVNDAADIGAVFVEIQMMREVDRGFHLPSIDLPFESVTTMSEGRILS